MSADNINYSDIPLYDIVEAIFKSGYDGVAIDNIHFARDWKKSLITLYNDYPDKKLWITDSSNVIFKSSENMLSKMFFQINLPFLSFREYIHLKTGFVFESIDLFDFKSIDKNFIEKIDYFKGNFNIFKLFKEYLKSGTMPIFLQNNICELSDSLINKTIFYDIPFYEGSINDIQLRLLKSITATLLKSQIPKINISSICREWKIGKEKLYKLLNIMEQAGLISIVKKRNNRRIYSKEEKIFVSDPALYSCVDGSKTNANESFIVTMFKYNYKVFATKNERLYDLMICDGANEYKIEVGDKRRRNKDSDFIISEDIELPEKNRIPLWLIGFIY